MMEKKKKKRKKCFGAKILKIRKSREFRDLGESRSSGIRRSMVIPKDLEGFGDLASYWSLVSSTDPGGGSGL